MTDMSRNDTVGTHRTTVYTQDGTTYVRYHDTDVVAFDKDRIVLNTGGYNSRTTKLRMNQAARQFGLGFIVTQKQHKWYVYRQIPDGLGGFLNSGPKMPFEGRTFTLSRQVQQ